MTLIFLGTAQSDLSLLGRIPAWVLHGSLYFVLGLLVLRASRLGAGGRPSGGDLALVVVLCTLYGVTDEVHASFVRGRVASLWNAVGDAGGATLGALLFRLALGEGPLAEPARARDDESRRSGEDDLTS